MSVFVGRRDSVVFEYRLKGSNPVYSFPYLYLLLLEGVADSICTNSTSKYKYKMNSFFYVYRTNLDIKNNNIKNYYF